MSGVMSHQPEPAQLRSKWESLVSALQVDTTATGNMRERRYLDRWTAKAINDLNVRLGHGGPALSSAAFAAGIADVRNVIETTNQANLDAERDRRTYGVVSPVLRKNWLFRQIRKRTGCFASLAN